MKSLEKNYHKIFNIFLFTIPVSFISMKIANVLIILFVLFNLIFFKKLSFNKEKLKLIILIAIPFLLDVIFFWNNNSYYEGLKATEKHLMFLIFPVFIIGYASKINFHKLIKNYTFSMVLIMLIMFVRYVLIYPDNIEKYLNGKHLWEMGYHFTNSFGIHAPWLNMHLAFVSILSFYLLVNLSRKRATFIHTIIFLLSVFFVLYVNTRVAIVLSFLGYFIVVLYRLVVYKKIKNSKKTLILLVILLTITVSVFIKVFPYTINKFTEKSFSNIDMIGRLDEFEKPEAQVFSALVTRLTIWKTSLDLAKRNLLFGFGASDSKPKLFEYYKETNQIFLFKYKFPVHNQYIDYLLKYGIIGVIFLLIFMFNMLYKAFKENNPVMISFVMLFIFSNLTDDFLIIFSGISLSAFWFSIFANQLTTNQSLISKTKLI